MPDVRVYHLDEILNLPPPSWLIDGILPQHTLAALAATKAAFKTFLAIDWGMCIATGQDWNGRKVAQGKVLHIFGEGGSGIRQRTDAWQIHNGVWLPKPSEWMCTITSVDLLETDDVDALIRAVGQAVGGDDLQLVVVDTLARNQGGDENNTQQMGRLIKQAEKVQAEFGSTVLFLHHFNRGGSFRGNSSLDGAFDTLILLDRPGMGDEVKVTCGKQKDADEFDPFQMRRVKIPLDWHKDGSMVLEMTDRDPGVESLLSMVVDVAGALGVTRAEAEKVAAATGVAQSTKFTKLWKKAVDERRIVLAPDERDTKGARYVRNMELLDIAV